MTLSEDMSPYCSVHDEWLVMKLCTYVGYHDANNVSHFGGDPVTQFILKKRFSVLCEFVIIFWNKYVLICSGGVII